MAKVKGEVKGLEVKGLEVKGLEVKGGEVKGLSRRFEVLGVIDLRGGFAVRARGGRREHYLPIESVAGESIEPGDPLELARQYVARFGVAGLYVADLDAIEHGLLPHADVRRLSSLGVPVWLDAGIDSSSHAHRALASGASRLIVGLETLSSFRVLKSIVEDVGREHVVFSLDLRGGRPIARADLAEQAPEDLAARAADADVGTMIALDLGRVGSGSGIDFEMLARITRSAPSVPLYAGGGVRGPADLEQLQRAGCDGALVASALLDGHITPFDLAFAL